MKKKSIVALLVAAIMAFSAVGVLASDNGAEGYAYADQNTTEVTAWFNLVDPDGDGDEFSMVSEDGEFTIYITNDTPDNNDDQGEDNDDQGDDNDDQGENDDEQ